MKLPLFAVLGAACFAAGWWVDAWAGEPGDDVSSTNKTEAPPVAVAGKTPAGGVVVVATAADLPPIAGIHTVEDLLKMVIPGRPFASEMQLMRAAAGLSPAELPELAAQLEAMGKSAGSDVEKTRAALAAVIGPWLAADAEAAGKFALSSNLVRLWSGALYDQFTGAMAKLFRGDTPAAIRVLSGMHGRESYIDVRFECIQGLKDVEPKAALEKIVELDAKARNDWHEAEALGDFPKQWAEKDPRAAMTWALAQAPGFTRSRILREMAGAWRSRDAKAADSFVREIPLTILPEGRLRGNISGANRK